VCRRITGAHVGPAAPPHDMSYKVLALSKRPQTFSQVVGQTTVTRTLQNAIGAGRIGHAFLLSGARGVGKTTTARILAKALNCSGTDKPTPEPCLACASCTEIAAGSSLDVQEIDGASNNSVDDIRELRESARYNPVRDRFKIWIIDEVHMLSTSAFNALLKTLEEPPPRVKFIFATTEYHKIPETILSRCQQYDFRMIPTRELQAHLRQIATEDAITVSDKALEQIARGAEGSARDALSLFDQVLSFSGSEVKDEDIAALLGLIDRELLHGVSRAFVDGDSLALLNLVEKLSDYGADYKNFARELLLHLREILLLKIAPADSPLVAPLGTETARQLRPLAEALSEEDLLRAIDVLSRAESELRWAQDPRVTLELALLKLVQLRRLVPFAELVARLERLAGGAPGPTPPTPPGKATPRAAAVAAPQASPATRPAATKALAAPSPPAPTPATSQPPAPQDAAALLAAMSQAARPSLGQALRSAGASFDVDVLVLEVSPDFAAFAATHIEEYEALANQAAGRKTRVRVAAGKGATPAAALAGPTPAELSRQRMREEAQKEPAVQEALDLFSGTVVEVREAKG
jgi:DNA polymerase III subunit gamma/tau